MSAAAAEQLGTVGVCAGALGYALTDDAAKTLASDVDYRLRELLQVRAGAARAVARAA